MTWASNVGELGVRGILADMEVQLEGINTALNTPSALPGEVRMFVGSENVPVGWEIVGQTLTSGDATSYVYLPAPGVAQSAGITSYSSSYDIGQSAHKGMCIVGSPGSYAISITGDFGGANALASSFTDVSSGVSTQWELSRTLNGPNILVRSPSGGMFYSGGAIGNINSTGGRTSATREVSRSGVITTRASCPIASSTGCGGWVDSDTVGVFGSRTTPATNSPVTDARSFLYKFSTNTWTEVAGVPRPHICGATVVIGGKVLLIGCATFAGGDTSGASVIDEYDPVNGTWAVSSFTLPSGVTGVGRCTSARLADGRWIVAGNISGSVPQNSLLLISDTGIELMPRFPKMTSGNTNIYVADSGFNSSGVPVVVYMAPKTNTIVQELGYIVKDDTQEFLSKSAIVYARKLP